MTKRCPIMSKQTESHSKVFCFEKECAFWDEEMNMCCIKSAAIAVAGKKSGGPSNSQQVGNVYGITPTSAVAPNSLEDWINPNPYRVDCEYKYNGECETTNTAADYVFNGGL